MDSAFFFLVAYLVRSGLTNDYQMADNIAAYVCFPTAAVNTSSSLQHPKHIYSRWTNVSTIEDTWNP